MVRLRHRPRPKTNPVFYAHELELLLADEPGRLERLRHDPDSVDLLTWNVFSSLDTHSDRDWLAYRLQALGGPGVRAPIRLSLWTGRQREPLLASSPAYLRWLRERTRALGADPEALAAFSAPLEVPVRVESPEVLVLVDVALASVPRGNGGRDRVVELVDAGLEHARRLSSTLAVAFVSASDTPGAAQLSSRLEQLGSPGGLARDLPWRPQPPPVVLRALSWQELLGTWESEIGYLRLDDQPVRAFLDLARRRGLR
ncbi:MAG: hypothetical protein M3276_05235 [Actinomycetota bacterium]|nr:hypothetical protein [Actinomycetota bacterium]